MFETFGKDFSENPTPGNKKGGLYNIYLKSTGAKAKGGTTTVEGLLEYGEWLGSPQRTARSLHPGIRSDFHSCPFSEWAQVALFTTGRGTGSGNALGPVVKVSSNTLLWKNNDDMDINAGTILDRTENG